MRKTVTNYGHNTAVDVTLPLFKIFEWMKRRTVKRIMNAVLHYGFSLAIPHCMASSYQYGMMIMGLQGGEWEIFCGTGMGTILWGSGADEEDRRERVGM